MVNGIAEGTHEASATLMLNHAAPPCDRRVALLESAHRAGRAGRGLRRLGAGPGAAGTAARGRRGWSGGGGLVIALVAVRVRHVGGRGEIRDGRAGKDVSRAGVIDVRDEDARVAVAVCAREGDGLVGCAGLRTTDEDLRAGRIELGAALRLGEVERDDLVPDEVAARRDICREGQGCGSAVHWHGLDAFQYAVFGWEKVREICYALISCWYQVLPSDFFPI